MPFLLLRLHVSLAGMFCLRNVANWILQVPNGDNSPLDPVELEVIIWRPIILIWASNSPCESRQRRASSTFYSTCPSKGPLPPFSYTIHSSQWKTSNLPNLPSLPAWILRLCICLQAIHLLQIPGPSREPMRVLCSPIRLLTAHRDLLATPQLRQTQLTRNQK